MNTRSKNRIGLHRLLPLLAVFGMIAAGCGAEVESSGLLFRIGIVAPSAENDVAFTQSIWDSANRLDNVEIDITGGQFVVADAEAAIRGYAEEDYDLVIAHGSQYGASVEAIAKDFPEVAFAWGTHVDTFGLPNVSAYTVRADEGGYVLGAMAAELSEAKNIGIVGPIEVGDAKLYVDGFKAGAEAQDPSISVGVKYIESFSDVDLAKETAATFVGNGADVLTGTAQMVVGATGVAQSEDVAWFGTQSNQSSLGPDIVVASQVYHWEVILKDIIAGIEDGDLGGESHTLTLENGGIVIEHNGNAATPEAVTELGDSIAADIASGDLSTGQ